MTDIITSLDANTAQLTAPDAQWETVQSCINDIDYTLYKNAPQSFAELLNAGREHGEKEFLIYEGERWTFDQFFQKADAIAQQLQAEYAIQAGDRVVIAMRNYPEWMAAFAGIVFAGAVPTPLNSWGQAAELKYGLNDCGAKAGFFDQQRFDYIADDMDTLGIKAFVARPTGALTNAVDFDAMVKAAADKKAQPVETHSEDTAMIMYTSGTTGNPKGAYSNHRNICQTIYNFEFAATCAAMTDLDPIMKMLERGFESKALVAVPLFHVSGCHSGFLLSLRAGRPMVIMHKWDTVKALELIEKERITMISAVPTMLMDLLESPEWDNFDTKSMFGFGAGGSAQPPHLKDQIYKQLPESFPGTGYGMTESNACGFSSAGAVYANKPSSAGCKAPIVDVRIVDETGNDVVDGERGEVWLKSPTVVQGYWNKPEATAETFVDGWLKTGDVGYLDDEGYLFITDRIKDMVIRGGENIYSIEVESAILSHEGILEAAAFGLPHDSLGEDLALAVVCKPGHSVSVDAIQAHIAGQLAKFKVPSQVFFEESLPKNATMKILKKPLKEKYS